MRRSSILIAAVIVTFVSIGSVYLHAQASAIPSAQTGDSSTDSGRKLIDQMVAALGGEKWLNRTTWVEEGKTAVFYKGTPDPDITGFEEFTRAKPFGKRVVLITESPRILLQMFGVPSVKMAHDVAIVYTPDDAFEVTYKGKTELPKDELATYRRQRKYTLDEVIKEWARRPGTILTDEGAEMVERKLADRISILTADNQSAVLEIDDGTHLPISLTVQYRDPLYKDQDTDVKEFDNYQTFDGIATPMTVTRVHNGEIVGQRFLTKVEYNKVLPDDLFNPDLPVKKNPKK